MNDTLKRGLTLVAIYLLVLGASVVTGIVYTGNPNLAEWTQDMRNFIAGTPFVVVILMMLLGVI